MRLSGLRASFRLPVAPSMAPALEAVRAPSPRAGLGMRVGLVGGLSVVLGIAAGGVARVLTALIAVITNIAFYGRGSLEAVSPAGNALGPWVIGVPVLGGLVVGVMARYGSPSIRGHGIPEAMERVLFGESRIPARITFLKPLSAAVSIGTGGPFGAEGPIIATGGALGSLMGQVLEVSTEERKALLAAGAAAGMSATFGSPVSAVLLAIELLLFEYRARSLVPVALASAAACSVRMALFGSEPAFAMPMVTAPGGWAVAAYVVLGAAIGLASMVVTRAVYAVEDAFERLPIHWMWWPAIGGVAVGLVGYVAPHTLGVGYDNIERVLDGRLAGAAALAFCALKFASWCISLGSGTSGGTLAPLFTIGGAIGAALGGTMALLVPSLGVDPHVAALVGMAAMFAGASRALLTSVVFAFETTRQPLGLLPLLGGCTAAYLASAMLMQNSIMTEKIARRGARVVTDYVADLLEQVTVAEVAQKPVVALAAGQAVEEVRAWIASRAPGSQHQGYPVLDEAGSLVGVITRRDVQAGDAANKTVKDLIARPPAIAYPESSLREAADHMLREGIGRLPVVTRADPTRVVGIVTRSDVLSIHARRLAAERVARELVETVRMA